MAKKASIILFCLIFAVPLAAKAQGDGREGIARAVSEFEAIEVICPRYLSVNTAEARRFQMAFTDAGVKAFGPVSFENALKAERPRRQKEIEATGPQQWCAYQSGYLKSLGAGTVLGAAAPAPSAKAPPAKRISADDMATAIATFMTLRYKCDAKRSTDIVAPVGRRYGFDVDDFIKQGGVYEDLLQTHLKKAIEFVDALGKAKACPAMRDALRQLVPELA